MRVHKFKPGEITRITRTYQWGLATGQSVPVGTRVEIISDHSRFNNIYIIKFPDNPEVIGNVTKTTSVINVLSLEVPPRGHPLTKVFK